MSKVYGSREMEVLRGPDWLIVQVQLELEDVDHFADLIWDLVEKHFIYRIVLEMDEIEFMPSVLMGQLVMLQKRLLQHEGSLRLSGLSADCEQALRFCRLDHTLSHFDTRAEAVHGSDSVRPK